MLHKNRRLHLLFILMLITALLLSSCSSQESSSDGQEPVDPSTPAESTGESGGSEASEAAPDFITHEKARDIAIAFLLEKFSLEAPKEWAAQDQTPADLVGTSAYLYTSEAWSALVKAPVVAPQNLVYTIEIDHLSSGLHWEGEVDASGEVSQTSLTEPLQVTSAADAFKFAVIFITQNHGWDLPGTSIEQSTQPIAGAGVQYTFSGGSWVVRVEYSASAPYVPEYRIVADNIDQMARWTGTVSARGQVTEEGYTLAE